MDKKRASNRLIKLKMEEKVLKAMHMWQITQMSAKYLPSISKKNLGRGADNQNGNLRWYLP